MTRISTQAHEPDIDRAAERLSRAAPAPVAGAADAGVRARHRTRRRHRGRQFRARATAQGRARHRATRPRPRTEDPARLVFRPLEPFLVEGNCRYGRARSAAPRCCRSGNGWSATARPSRAREFEAALAEIARPAALPTSKRRSASSSSPRPRRSSGSPRRRRRRQASRAGPDRSAQGRRGSVGDRGGAAGARGAGDARQPAARLAAGVRRIADRVGEPRRSTFPRCRRRKCCRSRCRWSCSGCARRGRSSASPSRWRHPTTRSASPRRPTVSP